MMEKLELIKKMNFGQTKLKMKKKIKYNQKYKDQILIILLTLTKEISSGKIIKNKEI